jgi:hypothetical protein
MGNGEGTAQQSKVARAAILINTSSVAKRVETVCTPIRFDV